MPWLHQLELESLTRIGPRFADGSSIPHDDDVRDGVLAAGLHQERAETLQLGSA